MAECSYARCLQERRLIKRELMKWTKNMVFIVGLERVAEELMGRRKWKLYQEVLARSQLNLNQNISASQNKKSNSFQQSERENLIIDQQNIDQSHTIKNEISAIKKEIEENSGEENSTTVKKEENQEEKLTTDSCLNNSKTINPNITFKSSEPLNTSSLQSIPIDWKPNEKCYFCVDGKLLTVNEKGELVAESGPASSEAELAHRTSVDSDSDSSDSSPDLELRNQSAASAASAVAAAAAVQVANVHKTLTSRLRDSLPPNMTSFESMGAQMAAVASIQGLQSGLSTFYPGIWYHQLAQQLMSATTPTSSETPAAESSPSIKDSPSPSDTVGEQPLDLSAKPSPNSSTSGDQKQIFRAKPRMTTISGRRTYTEEELHSALQDIISGKLGTRRAAVLYGIPRSTLRNKVYKISLEQKRETSSINQPTLDDLVDPDEEDKDISGDEDKDEKLIGSSLLGQTDDLARITQSQLTSQLAAAAFQKLTKSCDSSSLDVKPSTSLEAQTKIQSNVTQQQHQHQQQQQQQQQQPPQTPPITTNPWLDPNVLFQSLLLTGGLSGIPGLLQPKIEDPAAIRELFSNWMLQQDELIKEHMKNTATTTTDMLANSKAAIDPRILLQNLPGLQQHQQSQHSLHHGFQSRLPKSDTPETASSVDISEASDDPSVILKIPSYKPVAGSSSSGKNGENLSSPASQVTPPMLSRSPQQTNNIPRMSSPLVRQNSESQSPPIICLRDVIANSLSRTFNQQANKDTHSNTLKGSSSGESSEQFKRASISVIKNIGGTDISRFAATPNILANNINNSSQVGCNNSANAGGKGTRPKRGKYRNYDRDSLVEAVKAVQRGEMSVHRAGSYYGVPHSTLEYKVKERHLMRPRKREPKPQPLDDRAGSSSNSSVSTKNTNIPNISAVSSLDKLKTSTTTQKPSIKNNPPFSSTSPNGMKVPIFDPAMAAQFQYAPHLFWPHSTGFGTLPIDFQRPPTGTGAPPSFPSNAEGFLASQMMQRFHEESNRLSGNNLSSTGTTTATSSSVTNTKPINSGTNPNVKSTRQIAESLYDTGGANGSFLDGIIRQTLDRKTTDIPHGALLDQLVKNTRPPVLSSSLEQQLSAAAAATTATTTHQTKTKRPGSPVHYPVIEIKRERSSPATIVSSDIDRNPVECDYSKESAESLIKIREGLALKMEDKQQQQQQQQQQQHQQLQMQHHHTAALHLLQQQQQQLQQQQLSGNSIRHLSIEDLNGGGSSGSIHDKLGQIKTELEDSL